MAILKSSKTMMFGYKVTENLYRFLGLTLDEFRKFEADQGDDIDGEFASFFGKLGPLRLREAMNWKIIALFLFHNWHNPIGLLPDDDGLSICGN